MGIKKIKSGRGIEDFKNLVSERRYFFKHEAAYIRKQYPDMFLVMQRRGVSKRKLRKGKFLQINVYSTEVDKLPDELFFDKQLNWHQQHFGKKGLIAAAGLYLPNKKEVFIELMQSDLIQQLFRSKQFRFLNRSQLRRKHSYWYKILLNAIMDYAIDNNFKYVYCPTANQLLKATKKKIDPSLFIQIYDHANRTFNCIEKKIKKAGYWKIKVEKNTNRIVRLKTKKKAIDSSKKIVCIFHDIEENIDANISRKECEDYFKKMLEIEKKQGVRVTYNILGSLFKEKESIIKNYDNHSIAFHSFNHNENKKQLSKVREVDLQVRGYRPPQSKITKELTDYNLSYYNFEWFMSSISSFGFDKCRLKKGIIKIPVFMDDFDLYKKRLNYEEWENKLIKAIKNNAFIAFGTHDCYGKYWIDKYDQLLTKIKSLGVKFMTCDEITGKIFLDGEL